MNFQHSKKNQSQIKFAPVSPKLKRRALKDDPMHHAWCLEKMLSRHQTATSLEERDVPLRLCETYHRELLNEIARDMK
jgi:hypothetical protein